MEKIRKLKPHEVDIRVGQVPKSGKGFSLLLYKDARVDRAILDEVYGAENWQNDFEVINGQLFASVSIWCEEKKQWITKKDVGTESNTEKEKGQASDAFKRACFKLGIGNELYNAPFIWVKGHVKNNGNSFKPDINKFRVSKMQINDNDEFTELEVQGEIDYNWETIYKLNKALNEQPNANGDKTPAKQPNDVKNDKQEQINDKLKEARKNLVNLVTTYCKETGENPTDVYATYKITKTSGVKDFEETIKSIKKLRAEFYDRPENALDYGQYTGIDQ